MARKREFTKDWTFARIELTAEQRASYNEFLAAPDTNPMDLLVIAMSEGYKFSAKYDNVKDNWLATLTGTAASKINDRVSLTAFHRTLDDAIAVLMFKHFVVAGQKTWNDQSVESDWG